MRGRAAGALTALLLLTTLARADESSGYGRGAQAAGTTPPNACSDFKARTTAVNTECCNDKTEDCSSGRPTSCDAACARVLLPYFADCQSSLGMYARDFAGVVALCHAAEAAGPGPPSTTKPLPGDSAFPGSRIITAEWSTALTGFIGEGAPTRWEQCYSTFTMDARTPATFHEQCDAHSTTLVVAHNTGGSFNDGRRTITNTGHRTFGGYVRSSSLVCCLLALYFLLPSLCNTTFKTPMNAASSARAGRRLARGPWTRAARTRRTSAVHMMDTATTTASTTPHQLTSCLVSLLALPRTTQRQASTRHQAARSMHTSIRANGPSLGRVAICGSATMARPGAIAIMGGGSASRKNYLTPIGNDQWHDRFRCMQMQSPLQHVRSDLTPRADLTLDLQINFDVKHDCSCGP